MPSTPTWSLPYPALSDSPNGPVQIGALATQAEAGMNSLLSSIGVNTAALTALLANDATYAEALATVTTSSTSYVDLGGATPSISLTSQGNRALVIWAAQMSNATAANGAACSLVISGATSLGASDDNSLGTTQAGTGFGQMCAQFAFLYINSGLNTYKLQYRVAAATVGSFAKRKLFVFAP